MVTIISTPIGNLKDISFRAIEALKECDFIICEDTRITGRLLNHYQITKEMLALNAGNEERRIPAILKRLTAGENAALVSDSGTPLISDPGARLVNELIKNEIPVSSIPGASAVLAALTLSGLPADSFIFKGFIPQKKGRQTFLQSLIESDRTVIFYESVYRIEKVIEELNQIIPERNLAVCRELTKMFEEVWRGTVAEVHSALPTKTIKGEFVVVVAPRWWKSR